MRAQNVRRARFRALTHAFGVSAITTTDGRATERAETRSRNTRKPATDNTRKQATDNTENTEGGVHEPRFTSVFSVLSAAYG